MKIDKNALYEVQFVHCFDDDDVIKDFVDGKTLIRMKGKLIDLGYELKYWKEINV